MSSNDIKKILDKLDEIERAVAKNGTDVLKTEASLRADIKRLDDRVTSNSVTWNAALFLTMTFVAGVIASFGAVMLLKTVSAYGL